MDPGSRAIRLKFLKERLDAISNVMGCIVECGVHSGFTLTWLARYANNRQVFGFDLWDSSVPIPLHELDSGQPPVVDWDTALNRIKTGMGNAGVDFNKVQLIKGEFSETLPRTNTGPLAFLHIDADCYYSYQTALENLWPRLNVGGVAVFDEYNDQKNWHGAKPAVDEYLQDKAHQLHEDIRWYTIKS